jgi:hypothetical protein
MDERRNPSGMERPEKGRRWAPPLSTDACAPQDSFGSVGLSLSSGGGEGAGSSACSPATLGPLGLSFSSVGCGGGSSADQATLAVPTPNPQAKARARNAINGLIVFTSFRGFR